MVSVIFFFIPCAELQNDNAGCQFSSNCMFRNNGDLNRAMMERFGRLIDDLGLKDLPFHGREYIRGLICKIDLTLVKLDTVVCSVDREHLLPKLFAATERVLFF